MQLAKPLPYDANFKFDSHEDCAVSIAQGVVQDAYLFMKDVEHIRRQRVECAFLKMVPDSLNATAPEYRVLVWHHLDVSVDGYAFQCLEANTNVGREVREHVVASPEGGFPVWSGFRPPSNGQEKRRQILESPPDFRGDLEGDGVRLCHGDPPPAWPQRPRTSGPQPTHSCLRRIQQGQ